MKVLYISAGRDCDYQCDATLHGMRSLLGENLVDVAKPPFMYQGADLSSCYGRGFTLYGLLPDIPVDREDIEAKIAAKFFDYIVYGSIWRCRLYWDDVTNTYPRNKVLLIDGEDAPDYLFGLLHHGMYFKRELTFTDRGLLPIQFAIPEEKIFNGHTQKSEVMAPLDPQDRSTYIYETEADYYAMYQRSMFAKTTKKAGYDCMRHYEIMANACVPWFPGVANCPVSTMTLLPKKELQKAFKLYSTLNGYDPTKHFVDCWAELLSSIRVSLLEHLTTIALAKRVLQMAKDNQ